MTAAHIGSWSRAVGAEEGTWSPDLYVILGRDPATSPPSFATFLAAVHEDDRARVADVHEAALRDGAARSCTARVVHPDGAVRWIEAAAVPIVEGGTVQAFVGTVRDVTDRRVAEAAMRDSEARYRTIVETTREGIWAIDADGITTFVNDRLARMLGYDVAEMLGRPLFEFMDEEGRRIAAASLGRQRAEGDADRLDFRFTRRDGTDLWTLVNASPLFDEDGTYAGAIAMFADITDRKAMEASLAHNATHDDLTGLPNRTLLTDRMQVALGRHKRGETKGVALLVCDLDRFKFVNDSLGHDAGDVVLKTVAERLQASVRPGDTVARIGGDEFVICCENVADVAEADVVAARVGRTLSKPIVVDAREIFVTASVGIKVATNPLDTVGTILRDADAAMYQAKEAGRDCTSVFDDALRTRAERRLEVESGLHHALERGELRVLFQPTMSIEAGGMSGVEALVRWQHPERGLRGPGDFIGIAEETGLIVPVGLWVLERACLQLRAWNGLGAGELTVAVNVSPRQLRSPELVDQVRAILDRTGIAADHLCLEITETALVDDTDAAHSVLTALKALGLRLAIDDFGTGYSSLSYLRRFPLDILKIDQSFVAQLGVDAESTAIVTSIVHLARALHLEIVAEGVETREQLAQLELLGCQQGRGYYWSRPVGADEITAKLAPREPVTDGAAPRPRTDVISVLVADDDMAHRTSVRRILERTHRFAVVAEASDGQEAVDLAATTHPDLVVLDLSMPRMSGLEALPRILATSPDTKVALLSGHIGGAPLAAGASAQLRKGIKPAQLVEDLLVVMGAEP